MPVLKLSIQDDKWSKDLDPKLQTLLSDLESGLGSIVRRQELGGGHSRGDSEQSLGGDHTVSVIALFPLT